MPRQFKSTDTSQWVEQFGTGKDGALTISTNSVFKVANSPFTTNANAYASFSGTSGNTSGTAVNYWGFDSNYLTTGDYVLIHQTNNPSGAGFWELNVITGTIGGGTWTVNFKYPLQNTYSAGCQIIKVPQFSSFTLNTGVDLYPEQYNETYGGIIAIFCNGTTTINGVINGNARGFAGGIGSAVTNGYQGDSSSAVVTTTSTTNNGAGGGGGGVGDGAAAGGGGGGGNGTAGTNGGAGSRIAGTGGSTDGNSSLTDFNFGAGGGAGGWRSGSGGGAPGNGGAGAAGLFIFSRELIVNGLITFDGGAGSVKSGSPSHGCGGGGAGGSILVKSITANFGSNGIRTLGGAGGILGGGNDGGSGGNGRIHLDYASSYTGTTNPTLDATQDSSLYPSGGSFIYNLI